MKKLFTLAKWRNFSAARARLSLKQRRRNRKYGDPPSQHSKYRKYLLTPANPEEVIKLKAPENFSFIDNPNLLLLYLETARKLIADRNQIFLDKSEVNIMTSDAIALLIAHLDDHRFVRNIPLFGNAPVKEDLRNLFIQSGFYDHVESKIPKNTSSNLLLHNYSKRKVKPRIAKAACDIGFKHTFDNGEIFEPLYEILIECMSNTNNHAGKGKRALYNWWLYVYIDPHSKITHYSFVDLGVGIFESSPVKVYISQVLYGLPVVSNIYLMKMILQGKIKSRTENPMRGKGLPQMYEHSKNPHIKNFKIISNNVYADLSSEIYRRLNYNFNGTFLYWELHP